MLGPVDYIVVGFKGNNFDGSVMDALIKAVDKKIIRVLDLVFVMKDKEGNVLDAEYEDQSPELRETFGDFDMEDGMPLLSESDVAKVGEQLENDSAAGILVFEHLWAKDLKRSLKNAGGFLIADGRIHTDALEEAMEDLEESSPRHKVGAAS
jgi:hypothetical protein